MCWPGMAVMAEAFTGRVSAVCLCPLRPYYLLSLCAVEYMKCPKEQ